MSDSQSTLEQQTTQLQWWKDYWRYQPVVARAIMRSPILLIYLVASTFAGAFNENLDKILRVPDGLAVTCVGLVITFELWSAMTGEPRQDHRLDYSRLVSAWGNGILYSLSALLGCLLFLGPGIYLMVTGSLGVVFVCLEKMRAAPAFDASRKLVKGYFWKSFWYLLGAPLITAAITLVLFIGVSAACFLINEHFDKTPGLQILSAMFGLVLLWFILNILSLQVSLYRYLKVQKAGVDPNDD